MGGTLRKLAVAGAALALAAMTASASSAQGARTYTTPGTAPLATALADPWLFNSTQRERALAMTRAAGASYVRLTVSWSAIAPSLRPDGFVATDPTSPGYNWSNYDVIVKQVEDAGLTPILDIESTPKWAYAKRPSAPNAGSPKASELGAFAKALAKHYDGSGTAPAVHVFQVWNEPNVSLYLNPVKASVYRSMVNAFAASVHAVSSRNLVVAGALDPFGHKRSKKQRWNSVAPLAFMRSLLCVSKGAHPHATCRTSIHFDAWSHHPYTFGGAFGHARNPDDVELGDMPEMRSVLQAAVRLHHIRSTNGVRFWVTEFGWDTSPPRRHAAPMGLAARWTAESLYQAWRSGVSLLTWFGLQDRGGRSPYQSGLFRHSSSLASARVKPVRTAFRFPFVAYLGRGKVTVWGRDATSDKQLATIQLRNGTSGHWRTVARIRTNKYGIFKATLRLRTTTKSWLRASAAGSGTSLAFSLKVPHDPHIGPWGN
jgi:cellulase (glycosyl hydrolase family 5)